MKKYFFSLLLAAALLISGCSRSHETLLLLGNVITMDATTPEAQAVFVEDGIIKYVGSEEEARRMCKAETVVKDYGKASIYPGFLDGHTHGSLAASRYNQADLAEINVDPNAVMDDFVKEMQRYMEEHPGQKIYKGSGWTVKDKEPHASMLDAICPDVPMVLNSEDGHSMWINTAAIKKYGLGAEAVEKYGADCIRLDKDGKPTGYISENPAIELIQLTSMTKEECKVGLLQWQEKAFSTGITATTEAAVNLVSQNAAEAYQELCDEGLWKLRTYGVYVVDENTPDDKVDSKLEEVLAMSEKYNGEYFRLTGVKIFMDGVIEAHTGWLEKAYSDQPDYYGLKRCPDAARVAKIVGFCNRNGMNVHFHSIGDAATRVATEGIEQAIALTGVKDGRNAISHLQVVSSDMYRRFSDANIIAVVAPLWMPKFPGDYNYTLSVIGDRADTQYPVKSFFDAGCKVSFHSDFPVSTVFSIPRTIYMAVTRSAKDLGPDSVLNPSECITPQQALEALTIDGAYMWHEENRMGTITPGKLANFVVFDTDFLKDDIETVWDAKLQATYVDGKVVYEE